MSYVNVKSIGSLLIILRLMKANQSLDPSMKHRSCEGYITLSPTFFPITGGEANKVLVDGNVIPPQDHRIAAEVLKMGYVPIDS